MQTDINRVGSTTQKINVKIIDTTTIIDLSMIRKRINVVFYAIFMLVIVEIKWADSFANVRIEKQNKHLNHRIKIQRIYTVESMKKRCPSPNYTMSETLRQAEFSCIIHNREAQK